MEMTLDELAANVSHLDGPASRMIQRAADCIREMAEEAEATYCGEFEDVAAPSTDWIDFVPREYRDLVVSRHEPTLADKPPPPPTKPDN